MEYIIIISITGLISYICYKMGYEAGFNKNQKDYLKEINFENEKYNELRKKQNTTTNDISNVNDVDELFKSHS